MSNILHFGVGNFHRAHQAWYTHLAGGWNITGVSMRSASIKNVLEPQGFNYHLAIRDGVKTDYHHIQVISDILVAPDQPLEIIEAIADPDCKIITLTITEKGYCLDSATGKLEIGLAAIASDLAGNNPKTVYGFIAEGLTKRWQETQEPITIVSCDNLPENGHKLRDALSDFLVAKGSDIGENIDRLVSFPNTMVDRITPATTDELVSEVKEATAKSDASPVSTEAFSEWVIEDSFCNTRPRWEDHGVQIVSDVLPFELRKLRMLNGAHTYLAYAGLLAGYRYVHEAIVDEAIRADVAEIMAAAGSSLDGADQQELETYGNSLIQRFSNKSMQHELAQIGMDGTLKIPVRWLETMQATKNRRIYLKGLAHWVNYVVSKAGRVSDPNAGAILHVVSSSSNISQTCRGLMEIINVDEFVDDVLPLLAE